MSTHFTRNMLWMLFFKPSTQISEEICMNYACPISLISHVSQHEAVTVTDLSSYNHHMLSNRTCRNQDLIKKKKKSLFPPHDCYIIAGDRSLHLCLLSFPPCVWIIWPSEKIIKSYFKRMFFLFFSKDPDNPWQMCHIIVKMGLIVRVSLWTKSAWLMQNHWVHLQIFY